MRHWVKFLVKKNFSPKVNERSDFIDCICYDRVNCVDSDLHICSEYTPVDHALLNGLQSPVYHCLLTLLEECLSFCCSTELHEKKFPFDVLGPWGLSSFYAPFYQICKRHVNARE